MSTMHREPWAVSEAFPFDGSAEEQLRFAASFAILAPSGRNTQPWRFAIHDDRVDVFADRSRRRWVADPDDRELEMSCGAALFHLRLALRHFGYASHVDVAEGSGDLIAQLRLGPRTGPVVSADPLFAAIAVRRTHRGEFEPRAVDDRVRRELVTAVATEGAHAIDVPLLVRTRVAELVAEADRTQLGDPAYRLELADWTRPNDSDAEDGVPGYALGLGNVLSRVAPLYFRAVDDGAAQASTDARQVVEAPVLLALTTRGDRLHDRVACGEGLAHLLLLAASEHVYASHLNQPIQIPRLRALLAETLGTTDRPQIMLRLGYAPTDPPTPRRRLDEIVEQRG